MIPLNKEKLYTDYSPLLSKQGHEISKPLLPINAVLLSKQGHAISNILLPNNALFFSKQGHAISKPLLPNNVLLLSKQGHDNKQSSFTLKYTFIWQTRTLR